MNDRHFGYITKSFNETPGQTVEKEMQQQVKIKILLYS
jgi:hypothetical protein